MAKCCSGSVKNTGLPSLCHALMDVIEKPYFQFLKDGNGVVNKIDETDTIDDAFWQALINSSDSSSRLFVLPSVKNVEGERADDAFETFGDNSKSKTDNGVRTMTWVIPDVDTYFYQKLKPFECAKDLGFGAWDRSENTHGDISEDGFLKPIPIQNGSMQVRFMPPTDTTVSKVVITFDFKKSFSDENWGYLPASAYESDVDVLSYEGLLDLYGGTPSAISTTGFTMPITSNFGGAYGLAVEDIAQASFEIYNNTTMAVVTISTMTESPEGTYAFTYAAQTSADELELRIASGVNGFDDTNLRSVVVTIP